MRGYEWAAGSVTGADHKMPGRPGCKNNQDALCVVELESVLVGVVADGCGSSSGSEVGATIGSRVFADTLASCVSASMWGDDAIAQAETATLQALRALASMHAGVHGDMSGSIIDIGLFTLIGFAITDTRALVFAAGDGVYSINGDLHEIDQGNMPDYLGYRLLKEGKGRAVSILKELSRPESLIVASDGLSDFVKCSGMSSPDGRSHVPEVEDFWQDDRYFTNKDSVRRALAILNKDTVRWDEARQRVVRHNGLLHDDTTLIVVRRSFDDGGDDEA